MALPRLLLIDDEPALAAFVAKAADMCGFDPVIAEQDQAIPRQNSTTSGRKWSRSILACRAWTGSNCCASSPTRAIEDPVLIISRIRPPRARQRLPPRQALGLQMVGPLEKPARLEELEEILNRAEAVAGAMIAQADIGLLDGFERALINGRLRMVYQPKVSLSDGRLRRVEALVRWDDPALGAVPPSRFVPLAEKHGLIDELTQWGLRTTLRQWLSWREEGSIPASPSTFPR